MARTPNDLRTAHASTADAEGICAADAVACLARACICSRLAGDRDGRIRLLRARGHSPLARRFPERRDAAGRDGSDSRPEDEWREDLRGAVRAVRGPRVLGRRSAFADADIAPAAASVSLG